MKDLSSRRGDVLVYCGDLTTRGALPEVKEFSEFIKNLNYRHKIVIAGNHD
ncbi:MAG: metallophosphoesterase [Bacteriovorax sp.]|nr:metallophosphoesterase [Bacteriovorax sp.]